MHKTQTQDARRLPAQWPGLGVGPCHWQAAQAAASALRKPPRWSVRGRSLLFSSCFSFGSRVRCATLCAVRWIYLYASDWLLVLGQYKYPVFSIAGKCSVRQFPNDRKQTQTRLHAHDNHTLEIEMRVVSTYSEVTSQCHKM